MINRGPVDVLVLAAGEPRLDGSVFAELERQAAAGTIFNVGNTPLTGSATYCRNALWRRPSDA